MRLAFSTAAAAVLSCATMAAAQAPASDAPPPPVIVPAPPAPPAPPVAVGGEVQKPQLKGASLYVYSFLDVRRDEFGDKVLDQFHAQLVDALKHNGVSPQLQQFRDSLAGALWVPRNVKAATGRRTYERVPVLETIAANRAQEQAAGTRYRLLVLPANFELIGAWRHYTVRWIVMDAATDRILWKRDYKGKHLTVWRTNENAEGRGRKLTEAGLGLMREDQLL